MYIYICSFCWSDDSTALCYLCARSDLSVKEPPPPPHVIIQLLQTTSSESFLFLKGRSEDNWCSWKHYATLAWTELAVSTLRRCVSSFLSDATSNSCDFSFKCCTWCAVRNMSSSDWGTISRLESMFCSACSFKRPYSALSLNSTYVC